MGGHGGLNILPQKKWNVYNYDNRDIVEKDKKIAAEKAKKKKEKDRQEMLIKKMEVLRGEDHPQQNQQQQPKYHSLITKQLHSLEEGKKHVNLFQKQQQILLSRDLMEVKRLQQAQFLKDKNMDYSSRFLGTYNDEKAKPWYLKNNKVVQNVKNQTKSKLSNGIALEMREFELINNQGHEQHHTSIYAPEDYASDRYNEIDRKKNKHRSRSSSRSNSSQSYDRSREKYHHKKFYQYNKQKLKAEAQLKQQLKQTSIIHKVQMSDQKIIKAQTKAQNELEILRQKRLKRQQKQRKKIQQLKAKRQHQ